MPLELVTVPCLKDNYAYLLHDAATGATALVDAPEAAPILAVLQARGWGLAQIFITHHHADHIDGVAALVAATGARVIGAAADSHRLPPLDQAVNAGDTVTIAGAAGVVLDVPGHTVGHVAFHLPGEKLAFTADSLMALGCGRLLEGTAAQMWQSLSRLAALDPATLICSGHEYTAANARFAVTIDPGNPDLAQRVADITAARAAGLATVPSVLSLELATNPFLRTHLPQVKQSIGMPTADDVESFAEIRRRKDRF
jgi:hydroxyacylglutathione hydrolase